MATVDEEEHAVLDRLTFDYHQKLQGKPQSHELVGAPRPQRGRVPLPNTAPGSGCLAPHLPSLRWPQPATRPRSSPASPGITACGTGPYFWHKNGGLGPSPA